MKPLFRLDPTCPIPIPVLRVNADGSPREEDGKFFVDAEQAASASSIPVDTLVKHWKRTMRDIAGEDAPAEIVRDNQTGEEKEIDFDAMSDEDLAARVQRRQRERCNFSADEYAEFITHARAMNYDLDKRQCYPRRIIDADTGVSEIVACAKIEVVEERVLLSGLFEGIDGPWYRGDETNMEWVEGWPYEKPPVEGKIIIHRKGMRPRTITGRWASFAKFPESNTATEPRPDRFWFYKGPFMLLKCLSMQGYRTVFRDIVGNVYIDEEFNSPSGGRASIKSRASSITEDADAGASDRRIERDDGDTGAAAFGQTFSHSFSGTVAPRTVSMLTSQLALLGYTKPEIDDYLARARAESPDDEGADPEAFYTAIYTRAASDRRGRSIAPRRYVARPEAALARRTAP